jgi:menaquinone-dependent protoporphyrinogen oxidase
MAGKVLVAFASKYGATKEIAEKIGEVLKQEGLQADVLPVKSVKNLADYQAIVIGSAVYMFNWRKEASNFLQSNEKTLSGLPVWVFSSGPTEKGDPVKLVEGLLVPKALKPVIDRIKPRDITVFHGAMNEKMGILEKWMVKMAKGQFGDFRDWDMITAWAKGVAGAVKKEDFEGLPKY